MRRVVEKAELVVREVVHYEWGPFDGEQGAIDAAVKAQAALEFSVALVRCFTEGHSWVLVERPAGSWAWVSLSYEETRPATRGDVEDEL